MNEMVIKLPELLTYMGLAAFLVSAITEVLKKLPYISKVPNECVAYGLSIALTILMLFTYATLENVAVTGLYIVWAIVVGQIVSFVAMFGWDSLTTLFDKFKKT